MPKWTICVKELGDLNIVRLGWWQTELPPVGSTASQWATFIVLKMLGLGLDRCRNISRIIFLVRLVEEDHHTYFKQQ
jgi:hypothetical protein